MGIKVGDKVIPLTLKELEPFLVESQASPGSFVDKRYGSEGWVLATNYPDGSLKEDYVLEELTRLAKNSKEISEDDLFRLQDKAQKETDRFIAELDKIMAAKEKEVMEV